MIAWFIAVGLITEAKVAAFNARVGGGTLDATARIFEVDYSDDPWKMSSTVSAVQRAEWLLDEQQPFMLLTCDGCGHCGAGVPLKKTDAITEQVVSFLAE